MTRTDCAPRACAVLCAAVLALLAVGVRGASFVCALGGRSDTHATRLGTDEYSAKEDALAACCMRRDCAGVRASGIVTTYTLYTAGGSYALGLTSLTHDRAGDTRETAPLLSSSVLLCSPSTLSTADPEETCVALTGPAAAATVIEQNTPARCHVHCAGLFYPYARLLLLFPCSPSFPAPLCALSLSLSLTVPIHTPACSHAGHHMCVRPRAERVCAGVRGVCRVRDAVPRRRHERVRQHGRGPLQRERHRCRQHHLQQRACRRRPRTARRVPAPPCHGRPDRRHLPRLPPSPACDWFVWMYHAVVPPP